MLLPTAPWIAVLAAAWGLGAYGVPRRSGVSLVASALIVVPPAAALTSPWDAWGWVALAAVLVVSPAYLGGLQAGRRQRSMAQLSQRLEVAETGAARLARVAVDAERLRIARELHDAVGHQLTVISVLAAVSRERLGEAADPSAVASVEEVVEAVEESSRRSLHDLRVLVQAMRSGVDPMGGALGASPCDLSDLSRLLDAVRRAGLEVGHQVAGSPEPISPAVSVAAFRVVQEGITNALRHAPGAAVDVDLVWPDAALDLATGAAPGAVRVRVRNGPTPAARFASAGPLHDAEPPAPGDGTGLLGVRERVAAVGGRCVAGLTPQGGFVLEAVLPVQR